jgi:proteasome lid subunit RPN8/RPN11
VIALRDGTAERVVELENLAHSPFRFEVGAELVTAMAEIEDAGAELGVIYHSHTRSDPYPSQTDINFAANWPGVEWLIVGTAGEEPVVRSYLIDAGQVTEVEVEVV